VKIVQVPLIGVTSSRQVSVVVAVAPVVSTVVQIPSIGVPPSEHTCVEITVAEAMQLLSANEKPSGHLSWLF
jgi:hypothetical protein